jgi:hypothetical protein
MACSIQIFKVSRYSRYEVLPYIDEWTLHDWYGWLIAVERHHWSH